MVQEIVNYRTGSYKALFLPETGSEERFDELFKYGTAEPSELKTQVCIRRGPAALCLEIDCLDPQAELINKNNVLDGISVWNGDLVEIFFGMMEGTPWQRQCCIGAGGGRFDSRGGYGEWHAKVWVDSVGWHANAEFPYSMLELRHGYLKFNLCRQAMTYQAYLTFSPVRYGFDDIANHADLFFCDHTMAWMLLSGRPCPEGISRDNFCHAATMHRVEAGAITDRPMLFNPGPHQMSVIWRSAGICGAALDYRKSGTTQWMRVYADRQNGVVSQNSCLHRVDLDGLESKTRYEYRVASLHYVDAAMNMYFPDGGPLSFTTFAEDDVSFSCGIFSDVHSQKTLLETWLAMPKFQNCDFHIQLGDLLSALVCTDNLFGDVLSAFASACPEKPLVMVRGNHDQERQYAHDCSHFNSMDGRTCGLFRNGDVCFMVLDTGNDNVNTPVDIRQGEELADIQEKWIESAVQSIPWIQARYRVVLMHIPPNIDIKRGENFSMRLSMWLADASVKPDLMLCGHYHCFASLQPGHPACYLDNAAPFLSTELELPFPLFVNSNNTAMLLSCNAAGLELTLVDENGNAVRVFHL